MLSEQYYLISGIAIILFIICYFRILHFCYLLTILFMDDNRILKIEFMIKEFHMSRHILILNKFCYMQYNVFHIFHI